MKITGEKLAQEKESSQIGEVWVSFFLNEVITIRRKDWTELSRFYALPCPNNKIDHVKIDFKNRKEVLGYCTCFNKRNEKDRIEEELLFHL